MRFVVRTTLLASLTLGVGSLLIHLPELEPTLNRPARTMSDVVDLAAYWAAIGAVAGLVYGLAWPRLAARGRLGHALALGLALGIAMLTVPGTLLIWRGAPIVSDPRLWLLIGGVGFAAGAVLGLCWRGLRVE